VDRSNAGLGPGPGSAKNGWTGPGPDRGQSSKNASRSLLISTVMSYGISLTWMRLGCSMGTYHTYSLVKILISE